MSDDRKDLPPVTSPNFLEKVREALSTYLGNRGNALDRGLTIRDLTEAGIISLRSGFGSGSTRNPISGPGTSVEVVYEADLTPPPTPTGFSATAAISNMLITCATPSYTQGHGHSRARLYGKTWVSGDLPVFSPPALLTEFSGTVGSYATNPATTWHLWLSWVSVDGVESLPAGGTNGITVTTGQNVASLLTALTGKIKATELYADLGTRINLIDAPTTGLVAQLAAANTAISTINTTLSDLASTPAYNSATTYAAGVVVTFDGALYRAKVSTLDHTPTDASYWEKIGDYASLGEAVAGHAVILSDHATRVTTAEGELVTVAGRATTLETAVNDSTTGLASKASVTQVATAKSEAISSAAEVTDLISARLNTGDFAAVQVQSSASADSVLGLLAQYTVKLDVGGRVSGYGIASSDSSSEFAIRADRFSITPPVATYNQESTPSPYPTGATWFKPSTGMTANAILIQVGPYTLLPVWGDPYPTVVPFVVQATATNINGVVVPAGVYMDGAYIKDLNADRITAGTINADVVNVTNVTAVDIEAGSVMTGTLESSGTTVVNSVVVPTWKIDASGATFNNATIRGHVEAASGSFSGAISGSTITGSTIQTAETGQRIQLDSQGLLFLTGATPAGKYGSFKYGAKKYGAGVLVYFNNVGKKIPFYVNQEPTDPDTGLKLADIHLINRTVAPNGPAEIGDICCVDAKLMICTTNGTPGVWVLVGSQT